MSEDSEPSLLFECLGKLLLKTGDSLRNLHARTYATGPAPRATWTQMRVMGCVLFSPEGRTRVKDISRELGLTPGAISQVVEDLVRAGLIERAVDERDRRMVNISLSPRGVQLRAGLDVEFAALTARLLRGVPEEKIQTCREVLQMLDDELEVTKRS